MAHPIQETENGTAATKTASRAVPRGIYEGGTGDARQNPTEVATPYNTLFRKRYRQLSNEEIMLHDAIKDKADELAKLFGMLNPVVYQRLVGAAPSDLLHGPRECDAAHVTLALRHLEDAVYRAVKALTA